MKNFKIYNILGIIVVLFLTTGVILTRIYKNASLISNTITPKAEAYTNIPLNIKIAQMLVVGYNGQEAYYEVIDNLEKEKISGVILFGRNLKNPTQMKQITNQIYKANPGTIPFVMIDQEGGQVSRINSKNGFIRYPSPKEVSYKYNNQKDVYNIYRRMARDLKSIGVNFNLAPCVDMKIVPDSFLFKQERLYGNNSVIVTKFAQTFIQAHKDQKIGIAIKHYPGLGNASTDAHYNHLDITKNWQRAELEPFIRLTGGYQDTGVMVAHVKNDKLDKEHLMSGSKKAISLLGNTDNILIISDAMGMVNPSNAELEQLIIDGINAGVDIFLFPNHGYKSPYYRSYISADRFIDIIRKALDNKKITEEQINKSYAKIMKYKNNLR